MKTLSTILIAVLLLFTLSQVEQSVLANDNYQLNLSHIECRGTYIEIHFVLLNTVEGDNISDLTYTYGTIPPGPRTGNVVHFTDNVGPGYYEITSASVWVNSTLVTLHNPGDYADNYVCQQQPTNTPTFTPTFTPTNTPTNTPTFTPTSTVVTPTETQVFTPTNTPETPTNTPEPSPTFTPTEPTTTATFSVPNTGRDDNFVGPAFIIAGLTTIGLGLALSKLLRKGVAIKNK